MPPHSECPGTDAPQAPDVQTLLMATLALMTAWAAPCPQSRLGPQALRRVLARKISAHLLLLQLHPQASGGARQIAVQLQNRWEALSAQGADVVRPDDGGAAACDAPAVATTAPAGAVTGWVH
ncbi:hypothetical protein [Ideonella livida]|uniref:Uncharacterized protein n=1 Tax=Ideonella livida TaxID=2707176 RepID=A0A7C9TIY4_9BURK|nr:hypothetical protein [Ideonella livida]NDY91580.1 hypothetical protein [Ideonella livida]